jgi:AcrR family transcriptional regulator
MKRSTGTRDVGRPRKFSDEDIFAAGHLVLRRDGLAAFSMENVAHELGCTRQALVRRFESRQHLLLAAIDAAADKITSDYGRFRESFDSPLAALRARMVLPPNSRPEEQISVQEEANLLAYIISSSTDPEFGQRFSRLRRVAQQEVEGLLRAAIDEGELAPVDVSTMADVLLSAAAGATVTMAGNPSIDPEVTLGSHFDHIIGPYRRKTPSTGTISV